MFRPLTHENLAAAEARIAEEIKRTNSKTTWFSRCWGSQGIPPDGEESDSFLEDGMPLPKPMAKACPKDVIGVPIEDVDKFYENQRTFVVIGNQKNIFRFSATNALWFLDPFNPIRRIALRILVHPAFSFIVMTTIIVNFFLMTLPSVRVVADLEFAIIAIYTVEFFIRILARGFLLGKFTYLRDPWNWLDFAVICSGYFSIFVDMGNISALRMFRILRSIKHCSCLFSMKIIVRSVFESVKNLRELVVFTLFSLSMCSLVGMQMYMGALRNECHDVPSIDADDPAHDHAELPEPQACQDGSCPAKDYCGPGTGSNPDYGYTNFDTFLWAMLSSLRLMTQDFWEDLHRLILTSSGMWNTVIFAFVIWGFFCVINFILAVVLMSYEWQKRFIKHEADICVSGKQPPSNENSVPAQNLNDSENQQKPDTQDVDLDDEEDFTHKCMAQGTRFADTCCVWQCCRPWVLFKDFCSRIMFHPVTEIIIAVLIIANAILLALEHHNMTENLMNVISYGSCFFVTVFAIEIYLKIIAMDPKHFFLDSWNRMDFIIVVLSVVELCMSGMSTISVFRVLGLLKMAKDCKSWPTGQLVVSIIDKTSGPVGNLSVILVIILCVFAAVGMQLFGKNYIEHKDLFYNEKIPRWHFVDFLHAFMLVFRATCGEWIESMWDCMLTSGWTTVIYFIIVVVICRFVVANLYRAIIVSEFNDLYLSESQETTDTNDGNNDVAFRRVSWGIGSPTSKLCSPLMVNEKNTHHANDNELCESGIATIKEAGDSEAVNGANHDLQDQRKLNSEADEDVDKFNTSCEFHSGGSRWNNLRRFCYILSENKFFGVAVMAVIITYSICLACEDVYLADRTDLRLALRHLDVIFTLFFVLEMLIKWMALGFRRYFTNCYCCFDFVIVLACSLSLVAFIPMGNPAALRGLRFLRGLVPLKILSYIQGVKVVLSALGQALPIICTLSLFSFIFWFVFAITGVKLFSGRFNYCVDANGERSNASFVPNREICFMTNNTWISPEMNFDNILSAFFALFQVATFKGWIDIMHSAVDTKLDIHDQPEEEANIYMFYFFVLFAIVGSFFTLNLYLGAFIYSFNKQKKKAGSYVEVLMTEGQKRFCTAVRKLSTKPPVRAASRPRLRIQAALYDLTTNKKFDLVIKLFVGAYFVLLMFEHFHIHESFQMVLDLLSSVLVAIFVLECAIKIFAFRGSYFKEGWNFFEFIVVALALIGVILKNVIGKYFASPVLLKVAGVLKIGLVLRLAKGVRAMRVPSFAFVMSLPALFNICLLHFVIMFAYAIFGMALFMNVKHRYHINKNFNFQTFGQSMILLFETTTLAGWDGIVLSIMNEDDCELPNEETSEVGSCGNKALAVTYVVSFAIISLLITINLFIAIILDSYRCVRKDLKKELKNEG